MYKKSLIAIGVLALCAGIVYGHPSWGLTTGNGNQWERKSGPTVGVMLKIAPWVRISSVGGNDLWLIEDDNTPNTFRGCIVLEVLNNFPDIRIDAALDTSGSPDDIDGYAEWSISLLDVTGMANPPENPTDSYDTDVSVVLTDRHFSGNPALLNLCVMVEDWEPINAHTGQTVAEVVLTMFYTGDGVDYEVDGSPTRLSVLPLFVFDNE